MKYIILLSLSALFVPIARAQKITVNESEADSKIDVHRSFPAGQGKMLDLQYDDGRRDKSTTITLYNEHLKQGYSKQLTALDGKSFEEGISVGNKVFLLYSADKHKDGTFYELNPEDGSLNATGASIELKGASLKYTGTSPDSSHFYLLLRSYSQSRPYSYTGVVIDRQMKVVTKVMVTEPEGKRIEDRQFALSNEGLLNLITAKSVKSGRDEDYNPLEYTVTQVDPKGHSKAVVMGALPAGLQTLSSCKAVGNNVQFMGLGSPGKEKYYASLVTGTFDLASGKAEKVKQTPLPEEYLRNQSEPIAEFSTKDGGQIIVLERKLFIPQARYFESKEVAVPIGNPNISYAGNTTMIKREYGPTGSVHYEFGDLYVFKFNQQQELEWKQKITKHQIATGFEQYGGTIVLKTADDGLRFLFMDSRKNTEVDPAKSKVAYLPKKKQKNILAIACVSATKDGKFSKVFIDKKPSLSSGYAMEFDGITQDGGNQVMVITSKRKSENLKYHMASITVE
ncbi:hypothetical protein [Chitinophaga silvisoli]|uniref:Uncharacterized protein n=1 Tax=Chitinophaga silvisoli TaxID=2291814 RepID=A0A3E1PA03_9BACT|nr:hypothetical protein [Chitinophaga silvisoli]RFM36991.1 hypothetical protein DXN04_05700 [Chitinophaga silvisoli]